MTKQEAIDYLNKLRVEVWNEDSDGYDYAVAIDMAIKALSNTPNTFNTLETLGITDKQINMAIGAIIHMLNIGYYSEDMEDALNSAIRVLTEVHPEVRTQMSSADCISRQDTIDAIDKHIDTFDAIDTNYLCGLRTAMSFLKEMPSAQPEQECEKCIFKPFKQFQTEIIRCKDCKDYQTDWEISHYPNRHYCATMDSTMPEDGFCSYAERRTDEAN